MNEGFQAVRSKRESFVIENQIKVGPPDDIAGDDFGGGAYLARRSFQNRGSGAVYKHGAKRPVYDGQALRELGGDNVVQKLRARSQGTEATLAQELAVEYGRRHCHRAI